MSSAMWSPRSRPKTRPTAKRWPKRRSNSSTSGTRTRPQASHRRAEITVMTEEPLASGSPRPRIVLGVCGGIAAYKAVEVCRLLVDAGAHVIPVLTSEATRFVGALTFSALASEPAQTSLWDEDTPIPHTRLGQSADLILVAPATAHLIARYAVGLSD